MAPPLRWLPLADPRGGSAWRRLCGGCLWLQAEPSQQNGGHSAAGWASPSQRAAWSQLGRGSSAGGPLLLTAKHSTRSCCLSQSSQCWALLTYAATAGCTAGLQEPAIDEELVAEMEELRKRVMELQVTLSPDAGPAIPAA